MFEKETFLIGRCVLTAQMIESALSCLEIGECQKNKPGTIHDGNFAEKFGKSRAFGGIRELVRRINSKRIDDKLKLRLWEIADFRDQIAHRLVQMPDFIELFTGNGNWERLHFMDKEMTDVLNIVHGLNIGGNNTISTSTEMMVDFSKIVYSEIAKARNKPKNHRA
jgi:uncharacterized protein with HEPN domain